MSKHKYWNGSAKFQRNVKIKDIGWGQFGCETDYLPSQPVHPMWDEEIKHLISVSGQHIFQHHLQPLQLLTWIKEQWTDLQMALYSNLTKQIIVDVVGLFDLQDIL